jgi:hypothetical protein
LFKVRLVLIVKVSGSDEFGERLEVGGRAEGSRRGEDEEEEEHGSVGVGEGLELSEK